MRVSLIVLWVASLQSGLLMAEWGDDESDIAKAEAAVIQYITDARNIDSWAAFGRGRSLGVSRGGEVMREESYFTLIAKSAAQPDAYYYAHGSVAAKSTLGSNLVPTNDPRQGQWEQFLRIGEDRVAKIGYSLYERHDKISPTGKVEGTERQWHTMRPPFHPLFMPVANHGSYLAGFVSESETERRFLQHGKIFAADFDPIRRVVKGAWVLRNDSGTGGVVAVTFAEAEGWKPVSTSWRAMKGGEEPLESLRSGAIESAVETRWAPIGTAEGKQEYLPIVIRVLKQTAESRAEREFYFKWKLGDAVRTAFAKPDDLDWREPMRRLFDEDFTRLFDEQIDARPLVQGPARNGG